MMQFELPKERPSIIKVIGVGGGGSNAVNYMYQLGIKGVDFLVCNTDHQALEISPVPHKIQLGPSLTEGRGAGAIPEIGKNAAIENIDEIREILRQNTKMVFITAGMGGGTGTGAAPIIAGVAKEMGILTVAIVTIPFSFEGKKRKAQADAGIEELKQQVDTLLVICNDKLREIHGNLKLSEAFGHADNILAVAAKSIAEIITKTLHINVDFADIQTVMKSSGVAIMGSGISEGENRAMDAVKKALDSPLLNDNEIEGARFVLLNITSGDIEVSMDEMGEITDFVQDQAGQTAEVIMGVGHDETLGNQINVTIIATGFKTKDQLKSVFVKEEPKVLYDLNGELMKKKTEEVLSDSKTPEVESPSFDLAGSNKPSAEMFSFVKTETKTVSETSLTPHVSNEPRQNINVFTNEPRIVHVLGKEDEIVNSSESPGVNEAFANPVQPVAEDNKVVFNLNDNQPESREEATFIFEINTPYIEQPEPVKDENPSVATPLMMPVVTPVQPPVQPPSREPMQLQSDQEDYDPFQKAKDRISALRELSYKMNTPTGLSDLEKEPAYKRRNVTLENVPPSNETNISKYTLSQDKDNKPEIKNNNSFLHDRVD